MELLPNTLAHLNLLLPAGEAVTNIICTWYLFTGRAAIKRGEREEHRRIMMKAVWSGVVFLAIFVLRDLLTTPQTIAEPTVLRYTYLALLIVHIPAATLLPFVAVPALWFALKGQFARHKPLARFLWPLWVASNITGIISLIMILLWGVPRTP